MASAATSGSNTIRGIFSMILGGATLTMSDAATKWLTTSLPIGEILFVRALFVTIAIGVILWRCNRIQDLRIVSLPNMSLRSFLAVGSTFLVVTSLSKLPLNEVIAILFAIPLTIKIYRSGYTPF